MRRLTDISPGSVSLLLPVYSYYSVLVSYRLLDDATYRLSYRFLDDAIGMLSDTFLDNATGISNDFI